jgi:glycine betaine/proline transport system substrate-binding protein
VVTQRADHGPHHMSSQGTITIGYTPTWTDGLSMAHVLKDRLGALGYEVELETFSDLAIAFTALAGGDIDIHASVWPDENNARYVDQFRDGIEDLVAYNQDAACYLAVPDYTDVDSIDELTAAGDRFDGRIIGIENGAAITDTVRHRVMPSYGLEDAFDLVTSSTPAMLAELDKATSAHHDVLVTLWTAFWANDAYPVKRLEDPENSFGNPESLHVMARKGFGADHPDLADYIGRIRLSEKQCRDLEGYLLDSDDEDDRQDAAAAWIQDNPDVLPAVDQDS